jgi:hypothetical protein
LFNHEDQLKEELAKLEEKLKAAEEKDAEKKKEEEKNGVTATKIDEEKKEDTVTSTEDSNSSETANGHIDIIAKPILQLVNGDVSHDSDSTAVNTPLGSSTPLIKVSAETDAVTTVGYTLNQDSELELTTDSLRLQTLHLSKLITFLAREFAPTRQKLKELLSSGDIKFSLLWCLFRLGSVISYKDYESGLTMAGEITSADYMRRGDSQEYFEIHTRYIDYNGQAFYYAWQRLYYPISYLLIAGKYLSSKISERSVL